MNRIIDLCLFGNLFILENVLSGEYTQTVLSAPKIISFFIKNARISRKKKHRFRFALLLLFKSLESQLCLLRGADHSRKTLFQWWISLCEVEKNNTHIHAVKLHPFKGWGLDIC